MALDIFQVLPATFIQETLATHDYYDDLDELYELDIEVRLTLLDLLRLNKLKLFNGIVYAFGWNAGGQLGTGNADNRLTQQRSIPTPIYFSTITDMNGRRKRVIQVSTGYSHSLILCKDGTVYSFGEGSHGRLGTGNTDNVSIPTEINTTNIGKKRVIQVSAGHYHSLFLCEDGSVYSCGWNRYGQLGQLGIGITYNKLIPSPIYTSNIGGKKVIQVSAGYSHSLILCEDGIVYSFGQGKLGRLGTDDAFAFNKAFPSEINTSNLIDKRVIHVSAGNAHSLILCDDGTVYSFGDNSVGQLGTGNTNNVAIPTEINTSNLIDKKKKVIQVSAGDAHSLILCEDGTVYSFGSNFDSQLGTGDTGDVSIPTEINTTNIGSKKIIKVSGGGNYSLVLCEDGTVYSFGFNGFGQLGTGNINSVSIPTPINTSLLDGQEVIDISAGGNYSLILT